jgi:hypothetical protein
MYGCSCCARFTAIAYGASPIQELQEESMANLGSMYSGHCGAKVLAAKEKLALRSPDSEGFLMYH